jgi:hypothetical protein
MTDLVKLGMEDCLGAGGERRRSQEFGGKARWLGWVKGSLGGKGRNLGCLDGRWVDSLFLFPFLVFALFPCPSFETTRRYFPFVSLTVIIHGHGP